MEAFGLSLTRRGPAGALSADGRFLAFTSNTPDLNGHLPAYAIFRRDLYGVFGKPLRRWAEAWSLLEPRLEMIGIHRSHAAVALRQAVRFPERVELQRTNRRTVPDGFFASRTTTTSKIRGSSPKSSVAVPSSPLAPWAETSRRAPTSPASRASA